jgi:hypothetical protein
VVAADADVVQAAVAAQGEFAVAVDDVLADSVVSWREGAGAGFRAALVGGVRGDPAEGSVRSMLVVGLAEPVELGLQGGEVAGSGLLSEPAFERFLEAFDAPMLSSCGGKFGWSSFSG